MTLSLNVVVLLYLVASICFIQALKGLSHPTTSRLGNTFGMAGMAIAAAREGIPFSRAAFAIEKHMRSDPRRVGRLPIRLEMPPGLDPEQRARLEHIARTCPVARSLSGEIETPVDFVYPD